ncbi:flagellar protein export ATPase FliI [Fervidibacillus albus]|uniref:Flagellar protein export ATPase FliI n=1 Tax=Fervidibacillus albus TaxID=2980026 RepID=A0A9E8LW79_9BACI|nr:flagellar protein export ATPase FliI [Fervidibacillus albus]WAA10714.1 flagellar protein export ATPase FliI [Fervidibacillus albus]
MKAINLIEEIDRVDTYKRFGRVKQVIGTMIEAKGPASSIGDICYIYARDFHYHKGKKIIGEVVGFKEDTVIIMPYTSVKEIAPGWLVENTRESLQIKVGNALIGKVLNSLGEPMDGSTLPNMPHFSTDQEPPNPLNRPPIRESLELGIRAIDGLLTIGKGQRIGIFAGSGVGKSTLLGMIARNTKADLNVIALIGERGREVREFIERDLGEEGLKKSIIVAATSDQPALMRIKGAYTATAIAEYFRKKGLNVMLMMDSVTRFALAQREVGLAVGEPPATKGYTPSVFSMLPKLLERTGTDKYGTITGIYTVLVDGDDLNEPITDTVRGILDGHIVLDRKLANKGQYPAINVLKSVSRLMNEIVSKQHRIQAEKIRDLLHTYNQSEDLINIGAYKKGTSKEIDRAIEYHPKITDFLKQNTDEKITMNQTIQSLNELLKGDSR